METVKIADLALIKVEKLIRNENVARSRSFKAPLSTHSTESLSGTWIGVSEVSRSW